LIKALPVERAEFNADGKLLAIVGRSATVDIRSADNGSLVCELKHQNPVVCVQWNPRDPQRLLTGSIDGTVSLWSIETKDLQAVFTDHTSAITAMAWNGAGTGFITGGADNIAVVHVMRPAAPSRPPETGDAQAMQSASATPSP
jgi:WD40 repeat protein